MRKVAILLSLIFLFSLLSCSRSPDTIGLLSPQGAVVYSSGKENSKIVFSHALLEELSGEEGEKETLSFLFPHAEIFVLDEIDSMKRKSVEKTLISFSGTETIEEAYEKEKKSIKKSDYLKTMKEISSGFDTALFDLVKKHGEDFVLYRAEDAVGKEGEGDKTLFLKIWIKAIVS